jgi:N-acetylmuramoyl-L-alanine amidase
MFAPAAALLVLLHAGHPQGRALPAASTEVPWPSVNAGLSRPFERPAAGDRLPAPGAALRASQQPSPPPPAQPIVEPPPDALKPIVPAAPLDPAVLATRPPLQLVVIDPGHGGDEIGVRGAGIQEKQLTFDVARRLRGLLEKSGLKVIMTRDGDMTVDVTSRAAAANTARGDLFLSLHANAAPSPTPAGAEIYHLLTDGAVEQVRQQTLKSSVTIPVAAGGSRPLAIIPWEMAQAPYIDSSMVFATIVAEEMMKSRVPLASTPVRKGPLRVLEGVAMPAVVIEMAYLSNPSQAKVAGSDQFRNGVAQALHDSVIRYRRRLEEAKPR